MLTPRQQSFLEARVALPSIAAFDKDIVIISIGSERGLFSNRHVMKNENTHYFVFLKDGGERWICADAALQKWLDQYHAAANRASEDQEQ